MIVYVGCFAFRSRPHRLAADLRDIAGFAGSGVCNFDALELGRKLLGLAVLLDDGRALGPSGFTRESGSLTVIFVATMVRDEAGAARTGARPAGVVCAACTHSSASSFPSTIGHFRAVPQRTGVLARARHGHFETIVVNNASRDETPQRPSGALRAPRREPGTAPGQCGRPEPLRHR